jgi:hypothetical protein
LELNGEKITNKVLKKKTLVTLVKNYYLKESEECSLKKTFQVNHFRTAVDKQSQHLRNALFESVGNKYNKRKRILKCAKV